MTRTIDPARQPLLHRLLGSVVAVLLVCCPPALPAYAEPTISTGLAFTIVDPRVTDSTGLARDTTNNVFWTANPNEAVAYAI
ncbi:MAG: hypothetical protein Q4F67_06420, partial [Propionibacteriaceae bacterium]|nr:hypothetical protein [Propionibacteriaceae bacterium]